MKPLSDIKVRFVGAGNMASSLIGGLLNRGFMPNQLSASDPGGRQRQKIWDRYGVPVFPDNNEHFGVPDIVILAVKPQNMKRVVMDVRSSLLETNPLVVSIAAGIEVKNLQNWLSESMSIVRTMPNTPALIGQGATGLFANQNVSAEQRKMTESIMDSVGISHWVDDEGLIDVVTALSGSGPAYFFLFMEYMQKVAEDLGLSHEVANKLTEQTALGSALLAQRSPHNFQRLRENVTSPNGTTEAALNSFAKDDIYQAFKHALEAANQRSVELSKEFGK